eukprot:365807-Alexandrium_andersonii.AAC.1
MPRDLGEVLKAAPLGAGALEGAERDRADGPVIQETDLVDGRARGRAHSPRYGGKSGPKASRSPC